MSASAGCRMVNSADFHIVKQVGDDKFSLRVYNKRTHKWQTILKAEDPRNFRLTMKIINPQVLLEA